LSVEEEVWCGGAAGAAADEAGWKLKEVERPGRETNLAKRVNRG